MSPFRGEDDEETVDNVHFVRYRIAELYHGLTAEASRFIMQTLKAIPRYAQKNPTHLGVDLNNRYLSTDEIKACFSFLSNRLNAEECLDHRWIMPSELGIFKREKTVFNSLRLSQFRHVYYHSRSQRQIAAGVFGDLFRPSSPTDGQKK